MNSPVVLTITALLSSLAPSAFAQQVDMAALQRWGNAKVVHFRAVGVYQGQTVIAYKEPGGQATVTDRVTLDFDWDARREKLIGKVALINDKSRMSDFRNVERSCPSPVPRGNFEYLTAAEANDNGLRALEIKGRRDYPLIDVTAFCRGSWVKKTVQPNQETVTEYAPVPSVTLLGMPGLPPMNGVSVAADGKSFTVKTGNWTWTMTPTIVASR